MSITVAENRISVTPAGVARAVLLGTIATLAAPLLIDVALAVATKVTGRAIGHAVTRAITQGGNRG